MLRFTERLKEKLKKRFEEGKVTARYLLRTLKLVWEAGPFHLIAIGVLTVGSGLFPAAQVCVIKLLIDGVVKALKETPNFPYLLGILALQLSIWLAQHAVSTLTEGTLKIQGDLVANHIRILILKKAADLDMAFFENPRFYDKLQNASNEVGFRPLIIIRNIFEIFQGIIILGSMLALLARLNFLIPIILALVTIPHAVARAYYGRSTWVLLTSRAPEVRLANYFFSLLTGREIVKEVQLFGLRDHFSQEYQKRWWKFFRENKKLTLAQSRSIALLGAPSTIASAGCYAYAVMKAVTGMITLGDLTLNLQAVRQAQSSLTTLFGQIASFYQSGLFLGNLFSFLDLSPKDVEGSLLVTSVKKRRPVPRPLRKGIEFKNVSFRYPGTDRMVLQGLNFTIRPGEKVAIVGENGAGKTTIVKLITRLYDPTEGEILLDGYDLREFDLDELRKQFAVIFQDFVRYMLSAKENIGFGQVEHLEEMSRIKMAAKKGGADSVINKLPRGYETFLGRLFGDGVDLSGGEWQKIALSRAFMRNPQIFILDEPTAQLDALAEYKFYRSFVELTKGCISILISHRFSTVRMADHILVLDNGNIIEEGTHEELLLHNGKYAFMFNRQAEGYK